ncbi:MAG: redoxin domain-containing protein [Thermodesulfovibrionales bacterium]|jgi:Tfp pilus assembly protein PilF/peroxiredoxin
MRRFLFSCAYLFLSAAIAADAFALPAIGAAPPALSLSDIQGKEVSLAQFTGKKAVIILFWATWSDNSPKALSRFEEFSRKYADRGFQVIGVNADRQELSPEDKENISKTLQKLGITFPILLDRGLQAFHDYGVIALPSTVVIAEGRVAYELPGFPLVGREEMFDYLLSLAGEVVKKARKEGYAPRYDAVADTHLARRFTVKGAHEMAKSLLKKAMEKDPLYAEPYLELARISVKEGKQQEAEETLRKGLLVQPGSRALMAELGYLLSRRGKVKEAREILGKAAEDDSYPPAHYYYAYALAKDGDREGSAALFQKALSLNPYDPSLHILMADLSGETGLLRDAASFFRKALELFLSREFPGIPASGGFHP